MLKNYNLEYYSEEKILNPPKHSEHEISSIIKLLSKNKDIEIAEFGCGGGRLTIPLLKSGYRVTAVDIDKIALDRLFKTAAKIKLNNKLKIKKTFPVNKKYDYIIGTDILHHVDINKYLKIFKAHLKKNGKIIFSEPNPLNISWLVFISLFLDWKQEKGILDCTHFSLKNKLIKNGFKNIKIIGLGLFPPQFFCKISLLNNINYFLGNLSIFKIFAFRLIITAQKI